MERQQQATPPKKVRERKGKNEDIVCLFSTLDLPPGEYFGSESCTANGVPFKFNEYELRDLSELPERQSAAMPQSISSKLWALLVPPLWEANV